MIPWPFKDKDYKVAYVIVSLSYFKNIDYLVTRICLKCVLSYIYTISKYKKISHPETVFWYGNIIIHWSTLYISILNEKLASVSNSHLTIKSGHSDIDLEFWNITFHHIMFQQNVPWHKEPCLNLDMNNYKKEINGSAPSKGSPEGKICMWWHLQKASTQQTQAWQTPLWKVMVPAS